MKNSNGRDVGMYSATHETVTVARGQRWEKHGPR